MAAPSTTSTAMAAICQPGIPAFRFSGEYGGLWQCVVQGFGGLRMLGGKLRISPNLPKAWKKLSYTLMWKGQKLAVTVSPGMVEIVNQTGSGPVSLEVWGKNHTFEKELIVSGKALCS